MQAPPSHLWYEDALAVPRPSSVEELNRLTPKQFELFSLLVVSAIYGKGDLKFDHTPFSHDGGKDADAEYILGVGLDEELQLKFRIWLEVKHRSKSHPGKEDVGSHVVDAAIGRAHTIIFVTNTVFSKNLAEWLTSFSKHTGVQHKLINGKALLEYAAKHLDTTTTAATATQEPEVESPPLIAAVCWFSLSPSDVQSKVAPHAVIARQGWPVYLNIEWNVPTHQRPFNGRIIVRSQYLGPSDVHPHARPSSQQQLFAPGDTLTTVHTIWPSSRRIWSGDDFEVAIESPKLPRVEVQYRNRFELQYLLLPEIPLANQQAIFSALLDEVSRWRREQISRLALFIAPPGAGKSHVLSRVRRGLAQRCLAESYVDCESVRDDRTLFRHVVQELLPLPPAIIDIEVRDAVAHWCDTVGLSADATHDVVEDLCGRDDNATRLAPRHRAELLSMLLGQQSSHDPRVIIVEDLHKAAPSLLMLLWELIRTLRDSGRGRILFILCTRPYANAAEVREEWLKNLETLSTSDAATALRLEQPSARASRDFLASAVAGLAPHHIDTMIEAVGRSPYSLREALLFLLQKEVLQLRDDAPVPLAVVNPLRLGDVIASPELKSATEARLKLLLDNQASWLRLYLLAGAAFGRAFEAEVIAQVAGIHDQTTLDETIDICNRWSVVGPSLEQREWLEFDHDLVRDTILRISPARQRMRVGAALYEQLKDSSPEALIARIAYQGGLPEAVLNHVQLAKQEARSGERLDDVIELNQLAIQTLDPELASISLPDATAELGFRIDSAVRFATPIRPRGLRPSDIDRSVLTLLIENLDCLAAIGSGSSGLSESMLTEATMIANRCKDSEVNARLEALKGRLSFERDEVESSLVLHERAEKYFDESGVVRNRARAENLIRLAISYRTLGDFERSLAELRRAMTFTPRGDWPVLNKIRNNVGAVFLKTDWKQTRHQWEKELAHARRHHLDTRAAHALLGLGFLDLFEGDLEEGAGKTRLAMAINDRLHLDNQSVRAALNLSVYGILTKDYDQAMLSLYEGEKTALRHLIGRRLWRVVANIATVHELRGETEQCAIRDRQVVTLLQGNGAQSKPRLVYGRQILALVNVVLRRAKNIGANEPLSSMPPETFEYARIVSEESGMLPDLMSNYCVKLSVGPRFLLTE